MQGLRSDCAPFWAPEKARVRWPMLDFVPALGVGDPRECRGYVATPPSIGPPRRHGLGGDFLICPRAWRRGPPRIQGLRSDPALFWAPGEGTCEVATSDSVPVLGVGDSRECRGYVAIPPSFGLPRRHGLGGQCLILSPRLALGTPENAGVT